MRLCAYQREHGHGSCLLLFVKKFSVLRRNPAPLDLQGSWIPLSPSSPYFSKKCIAVLCHPFNRRRRQSGSLVPRSPDEQLQQKRRKVNTFFGQPVVYSAGILLLGFRNQNSRRLELLQPVRQNVCGDAFTRLLEILKRAKSADHHIADDQQRPAIPENLKGDTDWAAGPALGLWLLRHAGEANKVTCKIQLYFRHARHVSAGNAVVSPWPARGAWGFVRGGLSKW